MIITYVTITSGFTDLDSHAVITSLNVTEEFLQCNATGRQNMQKFFYSLFIDIYGLYKPITKEIHLMSNFIFMKFSDNIADSYSMLLLDLSVWISFIHFHSAKFLWSFLQHWKSLSHGDCLGASIVGITISKKYFISSLTLQSCC